LQIVRAHFLAVNLPCYIFVIPTEETMITTIRRLGNSRGIIIPKPMLEEAGLDEEAEIALERGAIVLRKPRQGWAEASRKLAEAGDDKH
jgi:antitoxin MazE